VRNKRASVFPLIRAQLFLFTAALLIGTPATYAQNILGSNLVTNGGAETGPAGTPTGLVTTVTGWTRTGNANVLPYDLTGQLLLSDPAPPDHGFQYFAAGGPNGSVSTLVQDIDVSAGASAIAAGNIKFTASAYLGSRRIGVVNENFTSEVDFTFKNAGGQSFTTAKLGPLAFFWGASGISLQQKIGLVPAGTARITVTLTMIGPFAAADSISLVLSKLDATPGSVLGTNLVANGDAEAGKGVPATSTASYVPSWATSRGASVAPYGGTGWISVSSPSPVDRGVNLFCGGVAGATSSYQDIDVSPAAPLIDSGQVTYQVSAWLGGIASNQSPTLTYTFFDWTDKQVGTTAQLDPAAHAGTALVQESHSAILPSGTRRVHIAIAFPSPGSLADNIAFTLDAPSGPPVITPAGIVSASAFGGFSSIAPGSWIEIYGTFLSPSTRSWTGADFQNGVAPTSLDGVQVSIGGKLAFIDYVSGGQINALVPSDAPTGAVPVTVTNANGTSDKFWIQVNLTQPGLLAPGAFLIGGKQYVVALFSDGTFVLPANAIAGVASRPAKPGEVVTLYGVGFGPVTPASTAGTLVTQQNTLTTRLQMLFGATLAAISYDGLAPSFTGLYQFNVVVPSVADNNALPFSFSLGDAKGSQTLYIAVQN
jgi:uncharacterized protein (TIGR03437 family)